ncbi:MAG TPA: ATP-binding protein [Burkholderiaceae bacterium]|nr:ATP-binding protein [Burkholderiaceae bacterium]
MKTLIAANAEIDDSEGARLAALASYGVLDTPPEPQFDTITDLAAHLCGTPIALVSLVTDTRQWFKSNHGLTGVCETPRELAFCAHAVQARAPLIVEETHDDARFARHPLVLGAPFIRAYAGYPLIDEHGHALGTLCVIDNKPRPFTPAHQDVLKRLAHLVVTLLSGRRNAFDHQQSLDGLDRDDDEILVVRAQDAHVLYANQRAQERRLADPRRASRALPCPIEHFVAWTDAPALIARLEPVIEGARQQMEFDASEPLPDGQVRPVSIRAYHYRDAGRDFVLIRIHDMCEQRKAEFLIGQARERANLALGVAQCGVIDWNMHADVAHLSPPLRQLLNLPSDATSLTRREWTGMLVPEDEPKWREAVRFHIEQKTDRYVVEYQVRVGDRQIKRVREVGRLVPNELPDAPRRVVALIAEVATLNGAATAPTLHALTSPLNEPQREIATRAEQERIDTAFNCVGQRLVDDISMPLRIVSTFVRDAAPTILSREKRLPARLVPVAEALTRIERVSAALANFMADLSRSLKRANCDLNAEFHAVWNVLGAANVANIRIDPLPNVHADPIAMRRVAEVLLSNAVKFARDGERAAIEVSVERYGDGEVVIAVRDNGVGFPDDLAMQLFQPFARLHGGRFQGVGLGLAAMRSMVERHGGRVWAMNNPEHGASFYFALPERRQQRRVPVAHEVATSDERAST